MRKQYRCVEISYMKSKILIYQDGELIDSETLWLDEVNNKIEELESMGYTRGYTKAEVEAVKCEYVYLLENMI